MAQEGKIFIGGLNRSTTTDSLKAHFVQFGQIADCVIMKVRLHAKYCCLLLLVSLRHDASLHTNWRAGPEEYLTCSFLQDRNTQQPRGFGFVTFVSAEVAEEVASRKQVVVDGRSVEVKRAVPRGDEEMPRKKSSTVSSSPTGSLSPQQSAVSPSKPPPSVHTANKIFVGGIAWSTADDEFHRYATATSQTSLSHMLTVKPKRVQSAAGHLSVIVPSFDSLPVYWAVSSSDMGRWRPLT